MGGGSEVRSRYAEHSDLGRVLVEFVFTSIQYIVELRVLDVEFVRVDSDDWPW